MAQNGKLRKAKGKSVGASKKKRKGRQAPKPSKHKTVRSGRKVVSLEMKKAINSNIERLMVEKVKLNDQRDHRNSKIKLVKAAPKSALLIIGKKNLRKESAAPVFVSPKELENGGPAKPAGK